MLKARGMKNHKLDGKESAPEEADKHEKTKTKNKKKLSKKLKRSNASDNLSQRSQGDGVFQSYDLRAMGVPMEAWPQANKPNLGRHGYTVVSAKGAVPRLKGL